MNTYTLKPVILGLLLFCAMVFGAIVAIPIISILFSTATTHQVENSLSSKFAISKVKRFTACENLFGPGRPTKGRIFIQVQDANGQGINDVSVKIKWDPKAESVTDGFVVLKTKTGQNHQLQVEEGHLDFAMFKGDYWVELVNGENRISGVAGPFNATEGNHEQCDGKTYNYAVSHEVIFTQRD